MSELDEAIRAIINDNQFIDGDTRHLTPEDLEKAKLRIKLLMNKAVGKNYTSKNIMMANKPEQIIRFRINDRLDEIRATIKEMTQGNTHD